MNNKSTGNIFPITAINGKKIVVYLLVWTYKQKSRRGEIIGDLIRLDNHARYNMYSINEFGYPLTYE